MTECLPDLPRHIRQRGNEWQGADLPDGPWRSIFAPQQAHVLTVARREGLRQGRAEREWEVMRLWDRVSVIERRNQR